MPIPFRKPKHGRSQGKCNMKPLRMAITTGDIDGIGLEITVKALDRIKPQRGVQFYI